MELGHYPLPCRALLCVVFVLGDRPSISAVCLPPLWAIKLAHALIQASGMIILELNSRARLLCHKPSMWERDCVDKHFDSATVESPSKIVGSETVASKTVAIESVDSSAMPERHSHHELGAAAKCRTLRWSHGGNVCRGTAGSWH